MRDTTVLHTAFILSLIALLFSLFTAVFSTGLVAAQLQGVSINLTPAIHLGSAGLTNCCDLDTLSEGVLPGWFSILPNCSALPHCCSAPAERYNLHAALGQGSATLCVGEGLQGEGPLSTPGKLNSTSLHRFWQAW